MMLVRPELQHVESFLAALRGGWSPSTHHDISAEVIAEVEADPAAFLAGLDDRDPAGRVVTLPDGQTVPRLPSFTRWMWDGEFCGAISLRWQHGTPELPPTCLGHIGYSVVPWKRRLGYASAALRSLLIEARDVGLPFVDITTDPGNIGSQQVIIANGGRRLEDFVTDPAYGGGQGYLYRIELPK